MFCMSWISAVRVEYGFWRCLSSRVTVTLSASLKIDRRWQTPEKLHFLFLLWSLSVFTHGNRGVGWRVCVMVTLQGKVLSVWPMGLTHWLGLICRGLGLQWGSTDWSNRCPHVDGSLWGCDACYGGFVPYLLEQRSEPWLIESNDSDGTRAFTARCQQNELN